MTTINDYARAVAEAVRGELRRAYYGSVQPWYEIDIDAIIASVPAPDVQAQVTQAELDRYWDEWKARFVAEHQAAIDAAVAREREEVQAHAPLYLEWVKEGALSADDALERLVIWLRARSAKGE
jgi:hypothetical protein